MEFATLILDCQCLPFNIVQPIVNLIYGWQTDITLTLQMYKSLKWLMALQLSLLLSLKDQLFNLFFCHCHSDLGNVYLLFVYIGTG